MYYASTDLTEQQIFLFDLLTDIVLELHVLWTRGSGSASAFFLSRRRAKSKELKPFIAVSKESVSQTEWLSDRMAVRDTDTGVVYSWPIESVGPGVSWGESLETFCLQPCSP